MCITLFMLCFVRKFRLYIVYGIYAHIHTYILYILYIYIYTCVCVCLICIYIYIHKWWIGVENLQIHVSTVLGDKCISLCRGSWIFLGQNGPSEWPWWIHTADKNPPCLGDLKDVSLFVIHIPAMTFSYMKIVDNIHVLSFLYRSPCL